MVSYSYQKPIAGKIFNYKQALRELDFDSGTSNMTCDCAHSKYNYIPAGHVVTGDLRIVTDRHIRKLLMKGPQFREQNNINWNKNKSLCMEAVKKCGDKWCMREVVDEAC